MVEVEVDIERHKEALRMGIHFSGYAMKSDKETAEKLIDKVKKMDSNDVYMFLMGVHLATSSLSQYLSDETGIDLGQFVKKNIGHVEDVIFDLAKFSAE